MFSLSRGRRISSEALGGSSRGSVEAHPSRPDTLGLCNLGEAPWQATLPNGQAHTIEAGKTVRIVPGLHIDFGKVSGVICAAREGSLA